MKRHLLKITSVLLAVMMLAGCTPKQQLRTVISTKSEDEHFELSLNVKEGTYKVGDKIEAKLSLKNISGSDTEIGLIEGSSHILFIDKASEFSYTNAAVYKTKATMKIGGTIDSKKEITLPYDGDFKLKGVIEFTEKDKEGKDQKVKLETGELYVTAKK
ncbi:MAG: hypothetical protein Q8865_03830 [Bacillota bacterium]|nr:hypothetical protein [Bacillota bacterium]